MATLKEIMKHTCSVGPCSEQSFPAHKGVDELGASCLKLAFGIICFFPINFYINKAGRGFPELCDARLMSPAL